MLHACSTPIHMNILYAVEMCICQICMKKGERKQILLHIVQLYSCLKIFIFSLNRILKYKFTIYSYD